MLVTYKIMPFATVVKLVGLCFVWTLKEYAMVLKNVLLEDKKKTPTV